MLSLEMTMVTNVSGNFGKKYPKEPKKSPKAPKLSFLMEVINRNKSNYAHINWN